MRLPVRKILRSRLFGAWVFSMIGRMVSLVPLALLVVRGDLASHDQVKLYIATFAYVASSSYVLNTINEAHLFSKSAGERSSAEVVIQSVVTVAFGLAFLSPVLADGTLLSGATVIVAIALQPLVAQFRTRAIDSGRFRGAYASTALRDLPVAVTSIGVLAITPDLVRFLPAGVLLGTVVQLVHVLAASAKRDAPLLAPDRVSGSTYTAVIALSAVSLAAYQPLARLFAELSEGINALSTYELSDRPAYMVALALAGGVGTELQRRWRDSTLETVLRELAHAERIVIIGMAAVGVATVAVAYAFRGDIQLLSSGPLLILLPLSFIAESLYLLAILRTRLILANYGGVWVVRAYVLGLASMSCLWLLWRVVSEPNALLAVPVASIVGFSTAVAVQQVGIKRLALVGADHDPEDSDSANIRPERKP